MEEHSLLPAVQNRCYSGRKGCKDQILSSKAIIAFFWRRRMDVNIS
jgi:hypothetical protein